MWSSASPRSLPTMLLVCSTPMISLMCRLPIMRWSSALARFAGMNDAQRAAQRFQVWSSVARFGCSLPLLLTISASAFKLSNCTIPRLGIICAINSKLVRNSIACNSVSAKIRLPIWRLPRTYSSRHLCRPRLQTRLIGSDMNQFREEARFIAHLKHPHIVPVLDFGVENNLPFLVMEYAQNGTLRQRHAKGTPVPSTLILSYVTQVASALQYAHNQNVIHRDIKPENMLVNSTNDILLSDFGLAMVNQSSYQNPKEMIGTVAYMSPA